MRWSGSGGGATPRTEGGAVAALVLAWTVPAAIAVAVAVAGDANPAGVGTGTVAAYPTAGYCVTGTARVDAAAALALEWALVVCAPRGGRLPRNGGASCAPPVPAPAPAAAAAATAAAAAAAPPPAAAAAAVLRSGAPATGGFRRAAAWRDWASTARASRRSHAARYRRWGRATPSPADAGTADT